MAKEKTFQFVLTAAECKLFRLLRELEADYQTEYPMIHYGADPKLNKSLTLSLRLGGRQIESFEVSGSRLIEDCASICVQIVRKLLTSEESDAVSVAPQTSNGTSNTGDEAAGRVEPAPASELQPPASTNPFKNVTWGVVKQELIPQYVKAVSFTVPSDELNPVRRANLKTRFPGVSIIPESPSDEHHYKIEAPSAADQWLPQAFNDETTPAIAALTASTKSPRLNPGMKTFAEVATVVPSATTTATSRLSLLSPTSTGGTEMRSKSLASPTSPTDTTMFDRSPILRIAERIGLNASSPGNVIHAMWLRWQDHREVKQFAAVRKTIKLEQYYSNLVTLYVVAFHENEFELCFAILLSFQSTNYTYRKRLPSLATAVLAFQYLPEDNDLCRWIATLFAFLWGTQQYHSREHLLADFPQVNSEAFCKFIFVVAHTRDPFTRGHNTAVLAQWCAVHHHKEGDEDQRACQEVYSHMEDCLDKIRSEEAAREYDEAKKLVDDYVKSSCSQSLTVHTRQSTSISINKRKAETPAVQSQKKYKRGSGRGRCGRASS